MSENIIITEYYENIREGSINIEDKNLESFQQLTPTRINIKFLYYKILSIWKDVFLPQGFPNSVHPDYIPYQIWDTIQAFASTIMGILTTHSIMQGIGVGESSATPLAAAITWILKDGTGMIGRIIFAWWNGTALDGQCKKWRFFADILNDTAMGIELLIPYFSSYSIFALCASTAMKSVVGVAGGATRAAITQHQALQNNLADVSAKDGSQETCVNLIASFIGIFILSLFHDGQYIVCLYFSLVAVHLYANYSAVKSLCLDSINEDRLVAILKKYFITGTIANPEEINEKESVLLFQKPAKDLCGFDIKIGVSFVNILKNNSISPHQIKHLLELFQKRNYIIVINLRKRIIFIVLAKDAKEVDLLDAYYYACISGLCLCMSRKIPIDLFVNANTSKSSYLLNYFLLLTQFSKDDLKVKEYPPEYLSDIIDHLTNNFITSLKNSEWDIKNIHLPVEKWRFSWKST